MGRYRPNKKKAQKKNQAASFTVLELDRIEAYLFEYREGCHQYHDSNYTTAHVSALKNSSNSTDLILGATILFPALTYHIVSQPYLALSKELSNIQRKQIHEICTKLDLYHETSKVVLEERQTIKQLVISIYHDGFDSVIMPSITTKQQQQHCYRPWYCRHSTRNNPSSHVEAHRKLHALLDQPSTCLRETLDSFDYQKWQDFDLSHIPPPTDASASPWMYVETLEQLNQCRHELLTTAKTTELAFDLEFWNPSKHLGRTCLLQLSSNAGKSYVIDVLQPDVWDHLGDALRDFFENPHIVKIGHSISGDVACLHRDFGIHVMNAFDTYEAASVLQTGPGNLAALCSHYGVCSSRYADLKAQYQTSDWRQRPLSVEQIEYGRYDVHYLIALRMLLIRDLTKHDLWFNENSKQESQNVAVALRDTLRSIQLAEGDVDDEFDESCNYPMMNIESNLSLSSSSDDEEDPEDFHTPPLQDDPEEFHTPPLQEEEADIIENNSNNNGGRHVVGVQELRMQPELMRVISLSQQRCCENLFKNEVAHHAVKKHALYAQLITSSEAVTFDNVLLDQLVLWRSQTAQRYECLEGMICSHVQLLYLAWKRPTTMTLLQRLLGRNNELQLYKESSSLLELIAKHVDNEKPFAEEPPMYRRRRKRKQNDAYLAMFAVATAGILYLVLRPRR